MYYIFYSIVTVLSFLHDTSKGNVRLLCLILLTSLLTMISGLRFEVGTDYNNYIYLFELILDGKDLGVEPSINLLVKAFDYLNVDLQFVFVFYAIITIFGYISFMKYFSSNLGFSIFLYFSLSVFFFSSLNLIRQCAAVAIFLFSIRYILKKNFFKYLVCIIFASALHFSAILLLPCYYILSRNLGMKQYVLGFIAMYLSMNTIELFARMTKYGVYVDRVFENSANVYISFVLCLICLFFILLRKQFNVIFENKEKFDTIMNMNYLSLLLVSASLYSDLPEIIFLRYNYFFIPALLIFIPPFVGSIKYESLRYIGVCVVFILASLYFTATIEVNGTKNNLTPYKTVLSR